MALPTVSGVYSPAHARPPWLLLAPAQRPGWLDVGGRWPSAICVLMLLPLVVGLRVLFAYWEPSVRVGMLTEVLLLTFVMARSRAVRWHDVVWLTATMSVAGFVFFIGSARLIWPDFRIPALPILRGSATPTVVAGECGQVVLALLLLAGLDPKLRSQIRGFVAPVGRGVVLRAAGAIVLLACALWGGRHLVSHGTLVEVKYVYVATVMTVPSCVRPEPSIAPNTPASPPAACIGPANHATNGTQPGGVTPPAP